MSRKPVRPQSQQSTVASLIADFTLLFVMSFGSTTLAKAESYLCVEEQSTGYQFNKSRKIWQQTSFKPTGKYLVKPNTDATHKGKWIVTEIGRADPSYRSEYDFTSTGALRCEGLVGEFMMNRKSLRFLRTYSLGYWTDAILGEAEGSFVEGHNTPLISIGQCSTLGE